MSEDYLIPPDVESVGQNKGEPIDPPDKANESGLSIIPASVDGLYRTDPALLGGTSSGALLTAIVTDSYNEHKETKRELKNCRSAYLEISNKNNKLLVEVATLHGEIAKSNSEGKTKLILTNVGLGLFGLGFSNYSTPALQNMSVLCMIAGGLLTLAGWLRQFTSANDINSKLDK